MLSRRPPPARSPQELVAGRAKCSDSAPLRAYARYRIDTTDGYETLYRRLTDKQRTKKPPLGRQRHLG